MGISLSSMKRLCGSTVDEAFLILRTALNYSCLLHTMRDYNDTVSMPWPLPTHIKFIIRIQKSHDIGHFSKQIYSNESTAHNAHRKVYHLQSGLKDAYQ